MLHLKHEENLVRFSKTKQSKEDDAKDAAQNKQTKYRIEFEIGKNISID